MIQAALICISRYASHSVLAIGYSASIAFEITVCSEHALR